MNSSTGWHVSNFSFSICNVISDTLFAIINSSKSIGYILRTVKYPTGTDAIPLSSTPNSDPLITYLKLPSSTRNFIFVTISGHFCISSKKTMVSCGLQSSGIIIFNFTRNSSALIFALR